MDDAAERRAMRLALDEAEAGLAAGQAPFGTVVLDAAGAVIGRGHNTVRASRDPSAHGEVVAIRDALSRGPLPEGASLYTSCEPCLMCSAVIAGLGIGRVGFAARGTDIPGVRRLLGQDLTGAAEWVNRQEGWSPIALRGDLMRAEALEIMARFDWG